MKVSWKTKIRESEDGKFLSIPKFKRVHVDMAAARRSKRFGSYANSDLFPALLSKVRREWFGDRNWLWLNELPEGVDVDTSGFLAVVSFDVPDER